MVKLEEVIINLLKLFIALLVLKWVIGVLKPKNNFKVVNNKVIYYDNNGMTYHFEVVYYVMYYLNNKFPGYTHVVKKSWVDFDPSRYILLDKFCKYNNINCEVEEETDRELTVNVTLFTKNKSFLNDSLKLNLYDCDPSSICLQHHGLKDKSFSENVLYVSPLKTPYLPISAGIFPKEVVPYSPIIKLCVTGCPGRRNLQLINDCTSLNKDVQIVYNYRSMDKQYFHVNKDIDKECPNIIRKIDQNDLQVYNEMSTCDYILPLISPEKTPQYFGISNDLVLSGTVAWAIVLNKPVIAHYKLFQIYKNLTGLKYDTDDQLIQIINSLKK